MEGPTLDPSMLHLHRDLIVVQLQEMQYDHLLCKHMEGCIWTRTR